MGRYLTSAEAAELLRTSPGVLANLRLHGEGPPYIRAFSRKILYDLEELERWISQYRVDTIDSIRQGD